MLTHMTGHAASLSPPVSAEQHVNTQQQVYVPPEHVSHTPKELNLAFLPSFGVLNPRSSPSLLRLYLLHSWRDITDAAPPSTLPQGGVRQRLRGRREGIWKDLRVDGEEINR